MACATISLKRGHDFDPLSPQRPKRRRCTPMNISPAVSPSKPPSVFKESTLSLSKEQIAESIRSEIKRLQHRRQLINRHVTSDSNSDSDSNTRPTSPSTSASQISPNKKDNTPIFTFKQVTMLCEKMVKEREEELCEEYDKVLHNKLSEQYEAFLKFNHDQLQRHFSTSSDASYLS